MKGRAFEGKVAIITGGASGIGAALSRALGAQGAQVVVADRQSALAGEVAEKIGAAGGKARAAELDARDLASMTRLVSETVARSGRVDLFFNNAGIAVGGEMDTYAARDWDDVFDVNLRGVAYGIQAVYPVMIRQGSGHIVNTASVAGLLPSPANGSYTATKHAVVGMSKALRLEAKRHGVRVSVVCPGAIRTPILTGGKFGRINAVGLTDEKMLELWSKMWPMDADVFTGKVLRAIARNVGIIVVPGWWKVLWYLDRLSPDASMWLWGSLLQRVRADLEAAGARPVSARDEPGVPARDESAPAPRAD